MENLEKQFFDALDDNNIDIVNDLIARGVNVNAKNEIGRSALLIAITKKLYVEKKNYTDIIKLLIKSGADVNEIDRHKVSLLMKAIENDNDKDIIDILIKAGADVNKLDKYDNTALMISSRRNDIDITKMLIEAGADVNKVNKNDATALTFARSRNIANILINAGAFVDKESLVINAVKKGHSEIVELMIEKGVDVNIIYDFNKTLLMTAIELGDKENARFKDQAKIDIVNSLIKAGANVHVKYRDGKTLLMKACEKGYYDIVNLLIEAGVDVNETSLNYTTDERILDLLLKEIYI